jgi:hypothetical protein
LFTSEWETRDEASAVARPDITLLCHLFSETKELIEKGRVDVSRARCCFGVIFVRKIFRVNYSKSMQCRKPVNNYVRRRKDTTFRNRIDLAQCITSETHHPSMHLSTQPTMAEHRYPVALISSCSSTFSVLSVLSSKYELYNNTDECWWSKSSILE